MQSGFLKIAGAAAIAAGLFAAPIGFATTAQAQKTGVVKIGVNESLSGTMIAVGLPPAAAIRLATKEINDAGGFTVGDTTYKIQLVEVDNQSTTANAVATTIKLVEDEKVKFIFGPTLSTLAIQSLQVTVPNDVLQISAASLWQSTGNLSNPKQPLLFGTQMPVTQIADIDMKALAEVGVKKVAFMSLDDDTTKSNIPSFTEAAKKAGIEVVLILFPQGTTDYSSYVSRAKGEKVDGIYFLYPHIVVPELLRYVVDLGLNPKAFGGRSLDANAAIKGAIGKPIPFPFFATGSTPFFQNPTEGRVKQFVDKLTAFDPKVAGANANFAFFTYDFVPMLVKAMQQAGTVTDTQKVANVLYTMKMEGVLGTICFGKEVRTATFDGSLLIVRDGKIEMKSFPNVCN